MYYMEFIRSQSIEKAYYPGRVLIMYGPRRVGKTTMLQAYLKTQVGKKILSVQGDDLDVQDVFDSQRLQRLSTFAGTNDVIAIDEAQQVPRIGIGTKMIIDAFPHKQILLTGSSSFQLAGQVGEPLTGRHFTLTLLPLAQSEIQTSSFELTQHLETFLIYGSYPAVLTTEDPNEKRRILKEIVDSYLYKDILALGGVKFPTLVRNVAKMLAFQIGSEVSISEIANALQVTVPTVQRYIDILEKMFVIKRVGGLSRNLRNEIHKKSRYYFLDNGVRNAVIDNFNPLSSRNDVGALWENFCFMELQKLDNINDTASTFYFWRTHTGVEIDIIRESNATMTAYECKWNPRAKVKLPKTFAAAYPDVSYTVITPENYLDLFVPATHP